MNAGDRWARGSALMLMPAVFVVVIVLGSIAIDFGALHVRQRELDNAVAAAANDAASAALDIDHLRVTGESRLDPRRAEQVARLTLDAQGMPGLVPVGVAVTGPMTVTVTATIEVHPVLGRVVGAGVVTLESTQTASLLGP